MKELDGLDIMLDLETLGVNPKAPILSIGVTAFDIHRMEIVHKLELHVSLKDQLENYNRKVDAETIGWWMNQADDTKTALFNKSTSTVPDYNGGPSKLKDALSSISFFIVTKAGEIDVEKRIWANSPAFDCVILKSAYESVIKYENTKNTTIPWNYNAERDLRTLRRLWGQKIPETIERGVEHDALSDAIYQSKVCMHILKDMSLIPIGEKK